MAVAVAALVLVGAGVGVGMAASARSDSPSPMASAATGATPSAEATKGARATKGAGSHKPANGKKTVDLDRQAWAHKYGEDRSTMPTLPDTAAASSTQQAAARNLLSQTEAATAKYADLKVAAAAGFDLTASLGHAEKKHPRLAASLQRRDAGTMASGTRMPMLHVANKANKDDGKVLDPSAPETLMYSYQGHGRWTLTGVMYIANESYPQAPPDPGGVITRWHYHDKSGGQGLMMHVFFIPGNDLAHAYATEMDS
jgi:hypothetical protein